MLRKRARKARRTPGPGRVGREGGVALLADAWRAWLAENLLLGCPTTELVATLEANGVPRRVAAREIAAMTRAPWMQGARRVARRLRRYELVARVQREVRTATVERRSGVSATELFERYYAGSTPVVLTDALEPWPAVLSWSPAYFKQRFAPAPVEVVSGREGDPDYDANFKNHATKTTLGAFCDRVTSAGASNDFYLIANNHALKAPLLAPLFDDIRAPHPYLDDKRHGGCVSLWFGPAGTVTPLHHDTSNILFCQVYGRKKVLLFSPFELFLTHEMKHGVYSPIDAEEPDLDAFPGMEKVPKREVLLAPGEALFIPVSWWHHVRALEPSINLSFTNFRVPTPNRFEWYYPGSTE